MRRVGSIALVHETLSHAPDEVVEFDDIATGSRWWPGRCRRPRSGSSPSSAGSFGMLPAAVATPLAMVLTELLQNALEHGLARRGDRACSRCVVRRSADGGSVDVADNGVGLPAGFDLDSATGWACRSCGPWSWASWAGGCGSCPAGRRHRGGRRCPASDANSAAAGHPAGNAAA